MAFKKDFSGMVLMPGEEPVYLTTLHWVIYMSGLRMTLLGLILRFGAMPAVRYFLDPEMAETLVKPVAYLVLAVTLIGCFLLLTAFIRQASFALLVTNRRVVAKYGLISRTTFEMVLSKIEGANLDQSMWGRILGFGNIWIKGVGDSFAPIYCIAEPQEFQNALLNQINQSTHPNSQEK